MIDVVLTVLLFVSPARVRREAVPGQGQQRITGYEDVEVTSVLLYCKSYELTNRV